MEIKLSRLAVHRSLRAALITLFIGQGLLKVIMFMMPGSIAWFAEIGAPAWMPAFVVATELFLIMQFGLAMGGFYEAPKEPAQA